MKYLISDCISLSFYPIITKINNFNIDYIKKIPYYKKLNKFVSFKFEYITIKDSEEVDYDKIFDEDENSDN